MTSICFKSDITLSNVGSLEQTQTKKLKDKDR